MSDARNGARKGATGPSIPKGIAIGEFQNYKDASDLVEKLVAGDFTPNKISIIGHEPVIVERVRGRLGYGRIALSGSLTGFWIGILFALLVGSGVSIDEAGMVSYSPNEFFSVVIIAAGVGMLFNILRFALAKNKRSFLSAQMPVASRYEVIVPDTDVAAARKILGLATLSE